MIIIVAGANDHLKRNDMEKAKILIQSSKYLAVTLESNLDGILAALQIAKANDVTTIMNAAPARRDLDQGNIFTYFTNIYHFTNQKIEQLRFYSLLYKYLVLTAFFELTDILCVNETEAMIFAGYKTALDTFASEKEIENVVKILLTKCKLVIITLGAKGAAYANRESGSSSYRKVDAPILSKGATYVFLYYFNSQISSIWGRSFGTCILQRYFVIL